MILFKIGYFTLPYYLCVTASGPCFPVGTAMHKVLYEKAATHGECASSWARRNRFYVPLETDLSTTSTALLEAILKRIYPNCYQGRVIR